MSPANRTILLHRYVGQTPDIWVGIGTRLRTWPPTRNTGHRLVSNQVTPLKNNLLGTLFQRHFEVQLTVEKYATKSEHLGAGSTTVDESERVLVQTLTGLAIFLVPKLPRLVNGCWTSQVNTCGTRVEGFYLQRERAQSHSWESRTVVLL